MVKKLKDFRCADCQKLLFRGVIRRALIEIKCTRCKKINLFAANDPPKNL